MKQCPKPQISERYTADDFSIYGMEKSLGRYLYKLHCNLQNSRTRSSGPRIINQVDFRAEEKARNITTSSW